jgi:hypothetical protein
VTSAATVRLIEAYFEREQQGFIERYGDWVYLLAVLGGGFGSALAWLVASERRERSSNRCWVTSAATVRLIEALAISR